MIGLLFRVNATYLSQMKWISFLFLITAMTNGCDKDPVFESDCDDVLEINKNAYINGPKDDFAFDTLVLSGNCLELTYFYGGGCGTTEMNLYDYDAFIDNTMELPKRKLRFSFKDEDNCEAYIKETISFDLSPLQKNNPSPIRLEIDGWQEIINYYY